MLLVKTKVDKSTIHHLGLFTEVMIPAGTKVWEFTPGFDIAVPQKKIKDLNEVQKAYIEQYAGLEDKYYWVVCDFVKFTNHSTTPNLDVVGDDGDMVANRDIQVGEELTMNYEKLEPGSGDFEAEGFEHFQK